MTGFESVTPGKFEDWEGKERGLGIWTISSWSIANPPEAVKGLV